MVVSEQKVLPAPEEIRLAAAPGPYVRRSSVHLHPVEDEEEEVLPAEDLPAEGESADEPGESAASHADGLLWHVQIVADDFTDPKHCDAEGRLKARRPVPQIRAADFFGRLERRGAAYVYAGGPLNGWPGLVGLELRSITCKVRKTLRTAVKRFWDADRDAGATAPAYPDVKKLRSVRCTMRAPPWSARGWAPGAPGYAFWAAAGPRVHFGRAMVAAAPRDAEMTTCHLFAHRYAKPKAKESAKDLLTYHAAVLVEFSDGTATVCELAWLNGLGGYGARSNWYGAPEPLYAAMPDALEAPWRCDLCEVRCSDVDFADRGALEAYLAARTGRNAGDRFLDPKVQHSGAVRLTHKSKRDLFAYVLNYVGRDASYHEEWRNCQTFAADLYGFLAGKKGVEPYSQVCRVLYKPRPHLFLYDPTLY